MRSTSVLDVTFPHQTKYQINFLLSFHFITFHSDESSVRFVHSCCFFFFFFFLSFFPSRFRVDRRVYACMCQFACANSPILSEYYRYHSILLLFEGIERFMLSPIRHRWRKSELLTRTTTAANTTTAELRLSVREGLERKRRGGRDEDGGSMDWQMKANERKWKKCDKKCLRFNRFGQSCDGAAVTVRLHSTNEYDAFSILFASIRCVGYKLIITRYMHIILSVLLRLLWHCHHNSRHLCRRRLRVALLPSHLSKSCWTPTEQNKWNKE